MALDRCNLVVQHFDLLAAGSSQICCPVCSQWKGLEFGGGTKSESEFLFHECCVKEQ